MTVNKNRFFERADEGQSVVLPSRSTKSAAGYDFLASEDVTIPAFKPGVTPVLVHTGIKVHMPEDSYLEIVNRSSGPIKRGLVMANGVGIIDADYDGEIMGQFINLSDEDYEVHAGDKLFQGIFLKYDVTENDAEDKKIDRQGGFGSTDESIPSKS